MKQTLRNLLAEGKTKQVIDQLRQATQNDADLHDEVLQLSARFSQYERQQRMGIEDPSVLGRTLNQINMALLSVINRLPALSEQVTPTSEAVTPSHRLTTPSVSEEPEKPKSWSNFDKTTKTISAIAGILAILTFVFKYCLHVPEGGDSKPFSVVVYTHGAGGKQDIVLMKETKLVADFGGRREVATVGENGQNTFNEVPSKFRNTKIGIGLQGTEGYALRFPDSTYLLNGEPIYLEVMSVCQTCVIEGFVQNQTQPLPNYIVSTNIFSDTTDEKGYFKIIVTPDKALKADYPINVMFKGKIVKRVLITPNPKNPAEILIDK